MENKKALPPVHPGEIIREDILPETGLSVTATAKAVVCLRVSRLFGSTPEFWMRLQADYDLKKAAQNKKVMKRVARIVAVKTLDDIRPNQRTRMTSSSF